MSPDLTAWLAAVRGGVADAQPRAGGFARHVSIRHTTASTNDDVARAGLEGAPEGYAVIAASQTAGRGRRGASWHSPETHGLYLSTLLRPDRWASVRADAASPAPSLVTLMAGGAVVSAIVDVCALPVELKWPNDVIVRPPGRAPWRKLAGILAEGASDAGRVRSVVVGIGVNLRPSQAPPDVASRMIALQDLPGWTAVPFEVRLRALVAALLVRLHEGAGRLAAGRTAEIREQWRLHAPSAEGCRVRWTTDGVTRDGRAHGIDERGALCVTGETGETLVHGGDVTWLPEVGDDDA